MKVIYNTKEIADNRNNYNRLTEKPLINSVELVGNITLNDINVYSKEEVKKLISSARSVKVAAVQPSPLTPNTTYYIGPDTNGIYKVYLTDASDPINYFQIGTTSFGKYFSGEGINVTDPQNVVSVLVDSESVVINSEGLMEARPIFEKMLPFTGATATKDGTKGIVPKPTVGQQDHFLVGGSSWEKLSIINKLYPVGSIYITESSAKSPNDLFPGTTWAQLSADRGLLSTANGGGTLVNSSLPYAKGKFVAYTYNVAPGQSGVFSISQWAGNYILSGSQQPYVTLWFGAYQHSNAYWKSGQTTVQPPAIYLAIWRRTA